MTVVSYHSTLFGDIPSSPEDVGNTSSQIFLSRGVASPEDDDALALCQKAPSAAFNIEPGSRRASSLTEPLFDTYSLPHYTRQDSSTEPGQSAVIHSLEDDPRCCQDASAAPFPTMPSQTVGAVYTALSHPLDAPASSQNTYTPTKLLNIVDKGRGKDVDRGRTVQRRPKYPNPLAKAESRPRFNAHAAIEVDIRPMKRRELSRSSTLSHFDDPTDPCAILEDDLLEPCPADPVGSTVSEVLEPPLKTLGTRQIKTSVRNFPYESLGYINRGEPVLTHPISPQQPLTLPSEIRDSILLRDGLPSATISSPPLCTANRRVPYRGPSGTLVPVGAQLPTETLLQIFYLLAPPDFNSARHACRSWFISSLECFLLRTILSRGGWSNAIKRELVASQSSTTKINDEWIMSKRVSRECALGPDWTGNGLSTSSEGQPPNSKRPGLVYISTVDFREVSIYHSGKSSAATIFTVSACGKFLMAANGCLVYIYELNKAHRREDWSSGTNPGSLRPVTSIVCPRRVLACSMDTSSRRYAIAVLLDGRMGMVCDINPNHIVPSRGSTKSVGRDIVPDHPMAHINRSQSAQIPQDASLLDRVFLNNSTSNLISGGTSDKPPFVASGITGAGARNPDNFNDMIESHMPKPSPSASSQHTRLPWTHTLIPDTLVYSTPPPLHNEVRDNTMPIEMGPRSLYRSLCSDDDPPRSVAICPQRRCIAFGCSAGIELHWVDALTGQDLHRWFPLTAPSDYLFFLPPRTTIDSAKKLRLISSASKPGERAAISQRAFGGMRKNSGIWESLSHGDDTDDNDEDGTDRGPELISRFRASGRNRIFAQSTDCSDHYRAVPLIDGYHILFTDPTTGLLCLGSDAPVGSPTKLLRKVWFQGPQGKGSPIAYSGSSDADRTVRVVAAYGSGLQQSIWFFSVPGDVFTANRGSQAAHRVPFAETPYDSRSRDMDWIDWWPSRDLHEWLAHAEDRIPGLIPQSVWPVRIRGQEIGTCHLVVDVVVDPGPSMTVWIFTRDGIAKVWRIDDGNNGSARNILVARDGTVRGYDGDGDLEMSDISWSTPYTEGASHVSLPQESFDGTTSFHAATSGGESEPSTLSEGDLYMASYGQHNGASTEDLEQQAYAGASFEATAYLHDRNGPLYRTSHGLDHSFESIGAEFVEGLTGVTRIDVEIR